jgi:hypothetical protein
MTRRVRVTVAALTLCLAACSNSKRLDFSPLLVGSDGPSIPGVWIFRDADSFERSWVKAALTPDQMSDTLKKTDFRRQSLLAFASGWDKGSTGTITVVGVVQSKYGDDPPVDVTVKVGQLRQDCRESVTVKNPFALAVIERPTGSVAVAGYTAMSFSDGCGKGE